MVPPIAEYAKHLGNVPISFTAQHFAYYTKHHRNDLNNYPFLKEKNTTETYGFMMVVWYNTKLIEFQLLPNYFVMFNELLDRPEERDQMITSLKASDTNDIQQAKDQILKLKLVGRHSDDVAAAFIGQLYLDGQHLPQNTYLGLLWYMLAQEHKETEAYTVKCLRLMQQHPHLEIDDNKWPWDVDQDVYKEIFSRIPYLEDWEEQIDQMYIKIMG